MRGAGEGGDSATAAAGLNSLDELSQIFGLADRLTDGQQFKVDRRFVCNLDGPSLRNAIESGKAQVICLVSTLGVVVRST